MSLPYLVLISTWALSCTAPDSPELVYAKLDPSEPGIYRFDTATKKKTRLTREPSDLLPRWSPDGSKIAFLSMREGDLEAAARDDLAFHWYLYVMDRDGSNQRRVSATPVSIIYEWSPDGRQFVFQSSFESAANRGVDGIIDSSVYVIGADGDQLRRLAPVEGSDSFPRWSPDGKRIAFCSDRDGHSEVFVMRADGTSVKRLTRDTGNATNPVWSPDGEHIALTRINEDGLGEVQVVRSDGTQILPSGTSGQPVDWLADEDQLLILADGQLSQVTVSDGTVKSLTQPPGRIIEAALSSSRETVAYRWQLDEVREIHLLDIAGERQRPGLVIKGIAAGLSMTDAID